MDGEEQVLMCKKCSEPPLRSKIASAKENMYHQLMFWG
jgi:hypothetical protein